VRLVQSGSWTISVSCPARQAGAVQAWMESLGARGVQRDPRDPLLLRVHVDRLPPAAEALARACRIDRIDLAPDGTASVAVLSGLDRARALLAPFRDPDAPALTPRQAELLQFCVERGYYSIPRRTTLRKLSAQLGISSTSLSLALRRAEAKLMGSRVEPPGREAAQARPSARRP
jgi:hypothetical protein